MPKQKRPCSQVLRLVEVVREDRGTSAEMARGTTTVVDAIFGDNEGLFEEIGSAGVLSFFFGLGHDSTRVVTTGFSLGRSSILILRPDV